MNDITKTLEECKFAQLTAIKANYPDNLNIEVEYAGHTYQADQKSYLEMLFALLQPQLPDNFYWLDKSNNKIPVTKQNLQELANLVFLKRFDIFNQYQTKKLAIKNASSIESLVEVQIL